MYREFYAGMDLVHLPLFTLVLFVSVFVIVVVRMFVFRHSDEFDSLARMPLSEGGARGAEVSHE